MANITWKGVYPALLTPFKHDDSIDFEVYNKNLQAQIGAGVDGIILGGSLGEASSLSNEEKKDLLQLNGQDRFKRRSGDYFTRVQRYEHHTGAGRGVVCGGLTPAAGLNTIPFGASTVLPATHIYSFALKPEEHQPSGTCNFSRIDNAVLNLSFSGTAGQPSNLTGSAILKVYAVNYNVLRIMSGMGGLAYSN